MSDLHGITAESTSDAQDIASQQQQTSTTRAPALTSSQRRSHPLSSTLSARGSTQAPGTSGNEGTSAIRRTAVPQLGATASALRRHSLSGASGSRIEEEITGDARDVANRFAQFFEHTAPIDSSDPSIRLEQHARRLTAMTQGVHGVFDAIARQSTSSETRITVLQNVPDTQEIQTARLAMIRQTGIADTLETEAGERRSHATQLRGIATQARADATTAATERGEADRTARSRNDAATNAEDAARKAAVAAKGKDTEATQAEQAARAAQGNAATKSGQADKAEDAARKARAAAEEKAEEADDANDAAHDARTAASGKAKEAEDAEAAIAPLHEEAGRLRGEATRAAATAANASEKDEPAAQVAAQRADARASDAEAAVEKAEDAAKQARAAAGDASDHAKRLTIHAQAQSKQAAELEEAADQAHDDAKTARADADDAVKNAKQLTNTATDLRDAATSSKANAQKLAKDAVPLRAAAEKAKQDARDAATKQTRAETHASDADEAATEAEQAASDAQDAAQAARQAANAAGSTLRDIIARTPAQEEPATTTREAHAADTEETAATDGDAAAAAADAAQRSKFAQWGLNVGAVLGQQAIEVGVTTALREAVNAGVEALLTHTHASDEAKAGIAGGLYGTLILANLMTILYHEQQKTGNPVTHAGNIAQIVSLSAALTAAATTGTLKDLVPSLLKTLKYSGGRDITSLYLPLSDNVAEGKANPLAVQAINAFFYSGNQMLVNSIQSFHGLSGAGFVDAMQKNATDPNTQEAETLHSGFASLAAYVVGNYAGEVADQFVGRILNNAMSGGNLADLQITVTPQGWPGAEKAWDTLAENGVSRTSVFYSVYGLTAAINPEVPARHFGETGASWLQNFVGGAFIALLTLPALMTAMKKARNGLGGGDRSNREEQGTDRITSASSSSDGSPPRTPRTENIAMRRMTRGGGGGNDNASSSNRGV